MNTKSKKIAILMATIMVSAVIVPMAMAQDPVPSADVPSQAVVGGSATPPYICAKFETPDHSVDDGTQISPIAGGTRMVNFYVVAGHPSDLSKITRIDVTVFKPSPDGSEKYQLTATKDATGIWSGVKNYPDGTSHPVLTRQVLWGDRIDMNADCDTEDTEDLVVDGALNQLDAEGRIVYGMDHLGNQYDLASVKFDLKNVKQIMIEIKGEMDYHQVSGDYRVEAVATDDQGNTGIPLVNFFEYLSIVSLRIDFTAVNWGSITAGEPSYILGDANIVTTPLRPTVQNMGNDPAEIWLHYTTMTNQNGKTIEMFDGRLGAGDWTDCPVSTPTVLMNADGTKTELAPCTPTQIDFSIHPPDTTQGGTYTGEVTIGINHYFVD
jgi:hypothetical protein